SVVVWDGNTIAADRQSSNNGLKRTVSKMRQLANGEVIAWVGSLDVGLALASWYEKGQHVEDWPKLQDDKEKWTTLVIITPDRRIFYYEQTTEPIECFDKQMSWGCGRDFALGAMAMGADARRAVEVASQFSTDCGMGVEAFDIAIQVYP